MPPERAREATPDVATFSPIGQRGLDLASLVDAADPDSLVIAHNVRHDRGDIRRRDGMQIVQTLANPQDAGGAVSFATSAQYAYAPWHAAQEFPLGPWAIFFHFKAVRPASNPGNHLGRTIMLREVADGTHKSSYGFELAQNGTFSAHFTRDSDSTRYTCSTVVAADALIDGFLFWNPYDGATGRLSLYVLNVLASSVTGPGADAVVLRSASARLTWGQSSSGTIPTNLETDTAFIGGIVDAFTALSWPGRDPLIARSNGRSLIDTCRRYARQSWPNPLESQFHYDFDGNGNDLSWSANHATVVGAPTYVARIAYPVCMGQHIGSYDKTNASRELLAVCGGRLFIQSLRVAQ